MTSNGRTANVSFAELATDGDYELSVWVGFDFGAYTRSGGRPDYTHHGVGDFVLACGREGGRWRLRVSPKLGKLDDNPYGDDVLGEPVIDFTDQTEGPDPLTLLRALLTGGKAVEG